MTTCFWEHLSERKVQEQPVAFTGFAQKWLWSEEVRFGWAVRSRDRCKVSVRGSVNLRFCLCLSYPHRRVPLGWACCLLAPGVVPGWKPALEAAALSVLCGQKERELCRSSGLWTELHEPAKEQRSGNGQHGYIINVTVNKHRVMHMGKSLPWKTMS